MTKQIVLWWNIPCSGMIGVLREYAQNLDTTTLVVTGTLSKSRKAMGWDDKGKLFDQHIIVADNEWETKALEILKENADKLHVFNGLTHPVRMQNVIKVAMANNIPFCNMSEAYANLESGFKKTLKQFYLSYIIPFKVKSIAKKSLGVLCLSGGADFNLKQFEKFGFQKSQIFPFGYYTEEKGDFKYEAASDKKVHILCPGLLEPYKGVDILIHAASELKNLGIQNFIIHITGNGSQNKYLHNLSEQLETEDVINFEGVLNSSDYNTLLKHIDILVAPGRIEPWGIRINEAIQRGNAVIVSDGIGASELIDQSKGGAVFKSGNAKDLATKIKKYISTPQELAKAKGANLNYKEKINCEAKAKELHNILKTIQKNAK